jgi:hypothetical protein
MFNPEDFDMKAYVESTEEQLPALEYFFDVLVDENTQYTEASLGERISDAAAIKKKFKEIKEYQSDYKVHLKNKQFADARKDVTKMRNTSKDILKYVEQMDEESAVKVVILDILTLFIINFKRSIPCMLIAFPLGVIQGVEMAKVINLSNLPMDQFSPNDAQQLSDATEKILKSSGKIAVTNSIIGFASIVNNIIIIASYIEALIAVINKIKSKKDDVTADDFDLYKDLMIQNAKKQLKVCDNLDAKITYAKDQAKQDEKDEAVKESAEEMNEFLVDTILESTAISDDAKAFIIEKYLDK